MCDDPNVKGSKPPREGLRETMQCYGRQHFAVGNDLHEHPTRHSLWKDSLKMECSKMRSDSSECMRSIKAILIHLEDY